MISSKDENYKTLEPTKLLSWSVSWIGCTEGGTSSHLRPTCHALIIQQLKAMLGPATAPTRFWQGLHGAYGHVSPLSRAFALGRYPLRNHFDFVMKKLPLAKVQSYSAYHRRCIS